MEALFARYMEGQFKDALKELEMPDSYYEKAMTSYESVRKDLTSSNSSLFEYAPQIILQGSIRVGTAIKPITDEGSYDVDIVCNLGRLQKETISQEKLKELVGREVRAYADCHGMKNAPHEGKRCWTLEYVDEANFHIDILPTVDNTQTMRLAFAAKNITVSRDDRYLAHTDKRHPCYRRICDDWPTTNPVGYADWFLGVAQYSRFRQNAAQQSGITTDEVKVYSVKTPLQTYVQVLKRHRDVYADERGIASPVRSIIITTLAGKAYESIEQHSEWYEDFVQVVADMSRYIERTERGYRLLNPSNSFENFLEEWSDKDMHAFVEWQRAAIQELTPNPSICNKRLFNKYARKEMRSALGLGEHSSAISVVSKVRMKVDGLSHHQHHGMTEIDAVKVVVTAEKMRSGGTFVRFESGEPLPKNVSLRFEAHADNLKSFDVKWQVTNDGHEATRANCLRGDFYNGLVLANGRKTRTESTAYEGEHYVECLLVKDGVVYGRSEPFVVSIVSGSSAHLSW